MIHVLASSSIVFLMAICVVVLGACSINNWLNFEIQVKESEVFKPKQKQNASNLVTLYSYSYSYSSESSNMRLQMIGFAYYIHPFAL